MTSIYVLRERTVVGANDLSASTLHKVEALDSYELQEALEKCFGSDAHFVQYSLRDWGEMPRLNKSVLSHIRAAGGDVLCNVFAVDIDNPGHGPWTSDLEEKAAKYLEGLPEPLNQWAAFYTTLGGMRLVYVLKDPIPVDEAEGYHAGLVRDLISSGSAPFVVDESCSDWTRLFRLPKVVRDGEPTAGHCVFREGTRLDVKGILAVASGMRSIPDSGIFIEPSIPDLPDDAYARSLLYESDGTTRTKWWHEAKKRLRGRLSYGPIFDQTRLAEPGKRDSTIHSLVGEAVSVLASLPGTSFLLVYALFLDPVQSLLPDEHGDFRSRCWRAAVRYWSKEQARLQAEQREAQAQIEVGLTILDRVIKGMREWSKAPELRIDDESAARFATSRLLACTSSHGYVMRPSGYYDEAALPMRLIVARIRELGMDSLIPLQELQANGTAKSVSAQQIIDRYGTVVRAVEGIAGSPKLKGAYIRTDTLCVPLFRRRDDLSARYDRDIDEWLRSISGDSYDLLVNWISHALAFEDGPICALSIAGPPGVGKKLLVQGLAECVNTEVAGDGKELFDEFQSHITRTPIFSINEGFPRKHGLAKGKDPADSFRAMVAGDPEMVNLKYEALMQVRNPLRLLFTANNLDVVSSLTAGRDLSPDDRAALAQRLLHIDCPEGSASWLRSRGGLAYTANSGRRWIRGDNGDPSDYIIASHFMYLYQNRQEVPRGNRFLVEGSLTPTLLRIMAMRSGAAPLVIETLVGMVERSQRAQQGAQQIQGIVVSDTTILVTVAAVVDAFRVELAKSTRREIEAHQVASVLRGIMRRDPVHMAPEVGKQGHRARYAKYYEIDPHTLLEEAEEYGWGSKVLSGLAARSPKRLAESDRFVRRIERAMQAP